MNDQPAPIEAMRFEEALEELETIVTRLEQGRDRLDESIADYERGVALKRHCEAKLKQARTRIEKIALDQDGTPVAESFEGTSS